MKNDKVKSMKALFNLAKCKGAIMFASAFGCKSLCWLSCLAALILYVPAAQAGSWLIQQEGSGTKSTTPASSQNGSWDMPNVPAQVVPRPFNPSVNTGVGASATSQGSITLICTWQPSSGNDPVPAVLTLKVTPTATGTVSYHQSGGSASYPSVSNGHGDEAVKTLSGPTNNLMTKRTEASGSWLKQIKTNGQNTLRLKVDQLSSSFASVVQGSGTAYVMVAAQLDDRSVKITRDGSVGDTEALSNGVWKSKGHTTFSHGSRQFIPSYSDPINWNVQGFRAQVTNPSNVGIQSYKWAARPRIGGSLPVLCNSPSPEYGLFPSGFEARSDWPQLPANNGTQSTAKFIAAPQVYERSVHQVWDETYKEIVTLEVKFEDGVVAKSEYEIGLHTDYVSPYPFSDFVGVPLEANVRRHPYAQNKVALTGGETLIADATQGYTWLVSPEYFSITTPSGSSTAAGRWMMKGFYGVDPDYQALASSISSVAVPNVAKDYGTFLQIFDNVTQFTGTTRHYDKSGYKGQTPFMVKYPVANGTSGAGGNKAAPLFYVPPSP